MNKTKIIMIHGNGGGTADDHWFPEVSNALQTLSQAEVIAETMPDNDLARASIWLPKIESFGTDESTILIGFSSGAVAALRYAETHRVHTLMLIGVCYTDLDDENEKLSGYYDEPWDWNAIKSRSTSITIFADRNDPYIPVTEAQYVRDQLSAEYVELDYGSHFLVDNVPELKAYVLKELDYLR